MWTWILRNPALRSSESARLRTALKRVLSQPVRTLELSFGASNLQHSGFAEPAKSAAACASASAPPMLTAAEAIGRCLTNPTTLAERVLAPGEAVLASAAAVDVEFPEASGRETLCGGTLAVTSHALAWHSPELRTALCLSLACVAELLPAGVKPKRIFGSRTPRVAVRLASVVGRFEATLCFAFRGAPPSELLLRLEAALAARAWVERVAAPVALRPAAHAPVGGSLHPAAAAGVAGILRRQEKAQQVLSQSMDEAFTDLTALMDKAREMLAFAERVRLATQRDRGDRGDRGDNALDALEV